MLPPQFCSDFRGFLDGIALFLHLFISHQGRGSFDLRGESVFQACGERFRQHAIEENAEQHKQQREEGYVPDGQLEAKALKHR